MTNHVFVLEYEKAIKDSLDIREKIVNGMQYLYSHYKENPVAARSVLFLLMKESLKSDSLRETGFGLIIQGVMTAAEAEYATAANYIKNGISLLEQSDESTSFAIIAYKELGTVEFCQSHYRNAVKAYTKAMEFCHSIDTPAQELSILVLLAKTYMAMNNTADAEETLLACSSGFVNVEVHADEAEAALLLGTIYNNKGEHEKAEKFLNKAKSIADINTDKLLFFRILHEITRHYLLEKKPKSSLRVIEEYVPMLQALNDTETMNRFELERIKALVVLEEYEQAGKAVRELIEQAEKNNDHETMLHAYRIILENTKKPVFSQIPLSDLSRLFEYIEKSGNCQIQQSYNAGKNDALSEMHGKIEIISSIGRDITHVNDLEELFSNVQNNLNTIMDASIMNVAQIDEDDQITYMYNGENTNSIIPEKNWLLITNMLTRYCWNNRTPLVIQDLENEFPVFTNGDLDTGNIDFEKLPQSIILFPVIFQGTILSVFLIQSFTQYAFEYNDIVLIQLLIPYISSAVHNAYQTSILNQQQSKLDRITQRDELTGIMNHSGFLKHMNTSWHWAQRLGGWASIIMIDADNFSAINEKYGMETGDMCLMELTKIIEQYVHRTTDIMARYGGELFIIFLGNTNFKNTMLLAEKIRSAIENRKFAINNTTFTLTASLGVASAHLLHYRELHNDVLIEKADESLYIAKNDGKNQVRGFLLAD